MRKHSTFNTIKPYLSASFAITAVALLMAAIYILSGTAQHWIAGLWGILILTIFVMTGQIAHTARKHETLVTQLLTTKERLANEIKHRLWAEKTTSESKIQSQIIDESFPGLLAYFSVAQRCRYHNRAFRNWFGLHANQIDNQFLQDFANKEFYASIKNCMKDILAGKTVVKECTQKNKKGVSCHFYEQIIPHFDSKKKVIGFYALYTRYAPEKSQVSATSHTPSQANTQKTSPEVTSARIVQAIENNKFNLYFQKIISLKKNTGEDDLYEILIRMTEEENNLLPPGTFLPLVEKFKMMPRLDRWVVSHVVKWLSQHQTPSGSKFCINIAKDTLGCTDFPVFVRQELQKNQVSPQALCFEIEESDARANPSAASLFVKKIRQLGCYVSLCGISHNQASVNLLKKISSNFIKIDGSLVYNILHDEKDLTKVAAINRIAHTIKAQTIAELVETEEIMTKLREIDVDFAQGFGVAKPRPLKELE